jgi:hypothetical protein
LWLAASLVRPNGPIGDAGIAQVCPAALGT